MIIRTVKYLSLFIWLFVVGFAYKAYANDTPPRPHMIWEYTFLDNGDQYNPYAERTYLTCTYIGPYGPITLPAEDGRCPWLRMLRKPD